MAKLAFSTLQQGGSNNSPKNLFLDSTSQLSTMRKMVNTDGKPHTRNSSLKKEKQINTISGFDMFKEESRVALNLNRFNDTFLVLPNSRNSLLGRELSPDRVPKQFKYDPRLLGPPV